jgi:hypothetical protein
MRITRPFALAASVPLALLATTLPGAADITVRVSVKFFTDANGNTPAVEPARGPTPLADTPQAIAQWLVDGCNDSPDLRQRGYRFVLTENAVILPASLFTWFSRDPRNGSAKADLEAAALRDTATFRYRGNAMNVYINDVATSGSCSRPASGSITFLGRAVYRALLAHETGHFFNLCHTQGCQCDGTGDTMPGDVICRTEPGDDNLADTLRDLDTWDTPDQVALMNFGFNYGAPEVSDAQRQQVDYTFQNLMSYHLGDRLPDGLPNPYNLLTQDQLDLYLNTANDQRRAQVSGTTWFVAVNGTDAVGGGRNSRTPLRTVTAALNLVSGVDDVVLLRAGNYIGPPNGTIHTPCTLRATRGAVSITR